MDRPLRRWMFAVAARLGMTVERLGKEMTAVELREWIAFLQIENNPKQSQAPDPQLLSHQILASLAAMGKGRPING